MSAGRGPALFLALAMAFAAPTASAFKAGVSGMSGRPPAVSCTGCHGNPKGTSAPTLMLKGPTEVAAGTTARFTLSMSALSAGAGFDLAPSDGTLAVADEKISQINGGDLSQKAPWPKGQSIDLAFDFVAPAAPGKVTLFFTVLSADNDASADGDATASGSVDIAIGAPPDLSGVDLAGADFALTVVDLAITPRLYTDEPKWSLACSIGPRTEGAGRTGAAPLLLAAAALLMRPRGNAQRRRLAVPWSRPCRSPPPRRGPFVHEDPPR